MMRGGQTLLNTLLLAIAAHGLAPDALTPWRGWVMFKEYVRAVAESPDPGISVQLARDDAEETVSLIFVRQVVEPIGDWLQPAGGVVCEITFRQGARRVPEWEAWSFEAPSFDWFVDLVEGNPTFQELAVDTPLYSSVYWIET
jgi:hypothetical protein